MELDINFDLLLEYTTIHSTNALILNTNSAIQKCLFFVYTLYSTDDFQYSPRSILHQATLAKPVWNLAVKVMDMFEMGSLKDQKLNVKQLVSKPEFKQQDLAPLHALPIDEQCSILTKVVQKEIPLNNIKDLSKRARQISTLKTMFA